MPTLIELLENRGHRRGTNRIRRLTVAGFKCFREPCSLELGYLTLLCGRNSSGKSSFLQPALLMKQTYWAAVDSGPLEIVGPNAKFSWAKEMFWHGAAKDDIAKEISFSFLVDETERTHTFSLDAKKRLQLQSVGLSDRDGEARLDLVPDAVIPVPQDLKAETGNPINELVRRRPVEVRVVRYRCDVRLEPKYHRFIGAAIEIPPDLARNLGRWLHVPGLRGNPEGEYQATPPPSNAFPGWFHLYTAGILREWQSTKSKALAHCALDLQRLDLTGVVTVKALDDTKVAILVGRTKTPPKRGQKDLVNIADVGFGVSQVLPVVVALRLAKRGDVVHIEQPELHLHPEAQHEMGALLFEAAVRGVSVIAETHSMALIRGVQTAAAKMAAGEFREDLVRAHWFERDSSGAASVTSSAMTAEGLLPHWPEDLTKASLDADVQFLEASMGHR